MREIVENQIYRVGSSGCEVYLIDTHSKEGLVLIDCGMDIAMIKRISSERLDPKNIKHCIITHCHIDHIAACNDLQNFIPAIKFYAHELDSEAIEQKNHDSKTAASWYGTNYHPVKLFRKFHKSSEILKIGDIEFEIIHTPGHTPGSISIIVESNGFKILFGQDIHGPFYESFGSNLNDYQTSMKTLLEKKPDILCEGHFGIIKPFRKVESYIKRYMKENKP
ncbi:MAG: MBL fold metallo-hydrolase [Candidatus Lokiarchaeota archaeon]|nr:MBL fold metallo-hydrolase [Candidatus Lokiarchaeota archaeon]MBD3202245.1 MBL fold metallo-hydrolase [Candidatus Lokiarchaeota archaeon]